MIEFGVMDDGMDAFYEFLVQNAISSYELLTSIHYNVIHEDKVLQVIQGYGKLWNTVLDNFETEDYIVFMETGVYLDRQNIFQLAEALQPENVGIASPILIYLIAWSLGCMKSFSI